MQSVPILLSLALGILTGCAAVLIFVKSLKTIRAEVTTTANGHDHTRMDGLEKRMGILEETLRAVAARPEVEQYREVLLRLEKTESEGRTVALRLDETLESLKRTQMKVAARTRREKAEPPPAPNDDGDGDEGVFPMLPPAAMNGHQPAPVAPQGRRFGKFA